MITPSWVKDSVFYQVFPDRFRRSDRVGSELAFEPWSTPPTVHGFKGGDLYGVVEKLDYLRDLGVNAIYLNPIFASAANHRYHTYDYFHVDPILGGNEALRTLLDTAHDRGIRVVLDGVFNHASRGFWQFHHVLENGADSPYVDWFHFHPQRLARRRHFAPYPDPDSQQRLDNGESSFDAIGYGAWWNLPALPKFKTETPAVREFLLKVAVHWIEFGIDGWRLDVPEEIDDDAFWREFRSRVKRANSDAYIVGEIWHEAQRWLEGDQFDAVMNYPVMAACLGYFGGTGLDLELARTPCSMRHVRPLDAEEFAEQIGRSLHLYSPSVTAAQLNLLDSHDTPRFLSCVRTNVDALQMAVLFLMTIPGAPCLYYGDEIGLEGGQDPDCRRAFPWDPASWNQKLLDDVKRSIALRHSLPALRHGSYHELYAAGDVFIYARRHEDQSVMIAFNVGSEPQSAELSTSASISSADEWTEYWTGAKLPSSPNGQLRIELAPRNGAVFVAGQHVRGER